MVKVEGNTVDINGASTNHLPADRFEEFLAAMRAAVEAGEFDAELGNHGHGDAEVVVPKRKAPRRSRPRPPRRAGSRPPPAERPIARNGRPRPEATYSRDEGSLPS